MKTFRIAGLLGVVVLVGCGAGAVDTDAALDASTDSLSSVTAGYVTVQRDLRRCAAPACGGYFLSQPNHSIAPIYVKGLDFSQSSLGDADQAKVTGAPDAELLLFGKLSTKDRNGFRSLVVLDAYRGLPGRSPSKVSAIFTVQNNGTQCFAAPCMSFNAHKLNSTAKDKTFSTLSVASASYGFVDQSWLMHRVQDDRAIVVGSIVTGEHFPAGDEKVFDATQVFLHLPEGVGPCPTFMPMNCGANQVNVSTRDQNRCAVPAGCATPGMCSMMMPSCPADYSLTSMRSGSSACPSYTCDPSWVLQ